MPASSADASADALRGATVLAATSSAAETTALQTVLGAAGANVEVITDARGIVDAAKRFSPAVILVDTTMRGLDLAYAAKVVTRHPTTAASALVLLASATADEKAMRRLREHESFAILQRPLTCSSIRETFRGGAQFSREAKAMGVTGGGRGSDKLVPDCPALLRKPLSCPFHSFGVPVEYYQLRAGKVYSETDLFDVPNYSAGPGGEGFVDYNVAGLAVCRECYFASNDPGYFDDPENGMEEDPSPARAAYRIDSATREAMVIAAGHRGLTAYDRLGGEPTDDFFGWKRTDQAALVAYEIAIQSSRTLYEAAPIRRSLELLRLGNYELRRAMLHERLKAPGEKVLKHRAAAAAWLTKAFGECKGIAMYKAAYQLTAVNVHLNRDAHAFQFYGALREQSRLSVRDQEDPATLERFLRRAQNVWEDRQRHRHVDADRFSAGAKAA